MTSDDARIRYLVESPYGLAAMEIMKNSVLHSLCMAGAVGSQRAYNARRRQYFDICSLRDEIAGARARARGMKE